MFLRGGGGGEKKVHITTIHTLGLVGTFMRSSINTVFPFFGVSGQDTRIRFSLEPSGGDPGYNQWKDAMKMVARLPEGVPTDFRKKV